MEKQTLVKIGLGVLTLSGIATGIYLIAKQRRSNREGEITPPETLNTQLTIATSASGGSTSFPPTPFKNQKEGNEFRVWVNKNYPDKAVEYNLDTSGTFDNQNIRKAYFELGSQYNKSIQDKTLSDTLEAEKKKLQDQYNALTKEIIVVVPKTSNTDVNKKKFINIRSSAEVNDGTFNNKVHELKVGSSLEFVKDVRGKDQLTWFEIKYKKTPTSSNKIGYVRSDVAEKQKIRVPK